MQPEMWNDFENKVRIGEPQEARVRQQALGRPVHGMGESGPPRHNARGGDDSNAHRLARVQVPVLRGGI